MIITEFVKIVNELQNEYEKKIFYEEEIDRNDERFNLIVEKGGLIFPEKMTDKEMKHFVQGFKRGLQIANNPTNYGLKENREEKEAKNKTNVNRISKYVGILAKKIGYKGEDEIEIENNFDITRKNDVIVANMEEYYDLVKIKEDGKNYEITDLGLTALENTLGTKITIG